MTGTITRGRKFEQVLEGARAVFMEHGYEGASVDDIARAAGVSKATLYSYFSDKRLLFAEVARVEALRLAEDAMKLLNPGEHPEKALRIAGEHYISYLVSDFGQSQLTLCASESRRFPELGKLFYEAGPAQVRAHLGGYLTVAVEEGRLKIDDIDLAADQFQELCKTSLYSKMLCGVQNSFEPAEIERTLSGAIEMFMARYGV